MSIHHYIERQLIRKNMGTYFRKGKWVLHVLLLLLFWFSFAVKKVGDTRHWTPGNMLVVLATLLPFFSFFYFYCLYLIPFCFKRNRFRKFWLLLLALLAFCPLLDYLVQRWTAPCLPAAPGPPLHWLAEVGKTYFSFITSFIGYTSMLYFMELLEGIHTYKETDKNQTQLAATELHRIKTQMNPDFMIRSLDGIIYLAERRAEQAPDSVIDFSDVLRYRLYRSREKLVPLKEELVQLENLFHLHNAMPGQEHTCTLETEGGTEGVSAVPLSLINVAEPLLATFRPGKEWSLLLYLLTEEKEVQIAAELSTAGSSPELYLEQIRENMERLLCPGLTFTVEKDGNTYSIRTCIPIFRNLTVSL